MDFLESLGLDFLESLGLDFLESLGVDFLELEDFFFLEPLEDSPLVDFEVGLSGFMPTGSRDLRVFLVEDFSSTLSYSSVILASLEDASLVKPSPTMSSCENSMVISFPPDVFVLSGVPLIFSSVHLTTFPTAESGVLKADVKLETGVVGTSWVSTCSSAASVLDELSLDDVESKLTSSLIKELSS